MLYRKAMSQWNKFVEPIHPLKWFKDIEESNEEIKKGCRKAIGTALRIDYHLPGYAPAEDILDARIEEESSIRRLFNLDDTQTVKLIRRCREYGIKCEPEKGSLSPESLERAEIELRTLKCQIYLRAKRQMFGLSQFATPVHVDIVVAHRIKPNHP